LGGIFSRSQALLSDAIHNLQDSISQLLSILGIVISEKGRSPRYTFGFKRVEILTALINGLVIFVIAGWIIVEGVKKIVSPQNIRFEILLPVSIFGLFANLASIFLLHEHAHESLNVKSSYLHLLGDALSSVVVVIGALAMKILRINQLDGFLSIIIALFILKESFELIRDSLRIFLQASPFPVDERELANMLMGIEGTRGIHHVHIWSLKDGEIHFEAHVEVDDIKVSETEKIYNNVATLLQERLNVSHVTLQFETGKCERCSCISN